MLSLLWRHRRRIVALLRLADEIRRDLRDRKIDHREERAIGRRLIAILEP